METLTTLTFKRLDKKYSDKVTPSCIASVKSFREFLDTLNPSKLTHYNLLDETFVPIYNKFRDMLYSSGFVNGNPEETKKSPDAVFLWALYGEIDCFEYSRFLETVEGWSDASRHHLSAYVRVECLKKEIDNFIKIKEL